MPLKSCDIAPVCRTSGSSLYIQVKRRIIEAITSGELEKDEQLPNLKVLASYFGVSNITIESALKELIAENVCYRRPKKGTYVGRHRLQSSDISRQQRVMIIYSESENAEYDSVMMPFFSGVRNGCYQNGHIDSLFFSGKSFDDKIKQIVHNSGLDLIGCVIVSCYNFSSILSVIRKYPDVGFVLLNFQFDEFAQIAPDNLFGVFNDEFCGGYMATDYLISQGCRRIGVLTTSPQYDINYKLRLEGYFRAHEDEGVMPDRSLIHDVGSLSPISAVEKGTLGCKNLLSIDKRLDGIFCMNDLLAAGAGSYLKELNPEKEIKLMGFDNLVPNISHDHHFHTIKINAAVMGQCAVKALVNRNRYPGKQIFIAPKLMIRNRRK